MDSDKSDYHKLYSRMVKENFRTMDNSFAGCSLGRAVGPSRPGQSGRRVVQLARHLNHRPAESHAREEPLRRLVPLGGR